MTEDRFFCHRAACELSVSACIKRQHRNKLEKRSWEEEDFPICLDCPQGAAILRGPKRGFVEIDLSREGRQRLLDSLSSEALEDGRPLGEHCLFILAAHALNFCPEYRDKLDKLKEDGAASVRFFPFVWF